MRSRLILLSTICIAAFSSCSTAYRTTQTPDDVYFSPARETDSYVQVDNDKNQRYETSEDDQWLRMRVRNRTRWSAFDDYDWSDYRYNSWTYANYSPYSWNSYWSSYYYWNSWYNPYCPRIILVNPKINPTVYTKVRNFSLAGYTNTSYSNVNSPYAGKFRTTTNSSSRPSYNNTNSNSFGNAVRKVFGNGGSSGSGSYSPSSSNDRPSRSYTPSSSTNSSSGSGSRSSGGGGSSGGSGGGGGGGVSRPGRG